MTAPFTFSSTPVELCLAKADKAGARYAFCDREKLEIAFGSCTKKDQSKQIR
jgi:hypothetical protein